RLAIHDRPAVLELDGDGDDQPHGRRREESDPCERGVEGALDHAALATPATCAKRSWYACTATRRSYWSAARRARAPISRVPAGLSYIATMAAASASGSPGAATSPHPCSRTMTAGSEAGSVAAMYGRPAARMPYTLLGT